MVICTFCFSIFVTIPTDDRCPYCGMEGQIISLGEYFEKMPTSFLFWIAEDPDDNQHTEG
jgi:hypothetical protein